MGVVDPRPALSICILRLLSTVNATRKFVFGLVALLPSFYPIFSLLLVRRALKQLVQHARCALTLLDVLAAVDLHVCCSGSVGL